MKVDQEIRPLRLAAYYDEADVQRALLATMDLFRRVGRETAMRLVPRPV